MIFSTMLPISFHLAVGYQCKIGKTNHPDAAQYLGWDCRIVAVQFMSGSEPMIVVRVADGAHIKGLFFSDLANETGTPLQRQKFERNISTGIVPAIDWGSRDVSQPVSRSRKLLKQPRYTQEV